MYKFSLSLCALVTVYKFSENMNLLNVTNPCMIINLLLCHPSWERGGVGRGGGECSHLSARYLLIEWPDFSQTYTDISMEGGKC